MELRGDGATGVAGPDELESAVGYGTPITPAAKNAKTSTRHVLANQEGLKFINSNLLDDEQSRSTFH